MTSATNKRALPLTPAPITSIQPGGGFCFDLERRWGSVRRLFVRALRFGRKADLPGRCESCPHNLVDARDLKLVRNVCCVRLPADQDPLRRRGLLPFARAGTMELLVFSVLLLAGAGLGVWLALGVHPAFWGLVGVMLLLWLFVLSFFRDPERQTPTDPDAVVSPADGTVSHVEEVSEADFPSGRALRVSIFLSVFNVHVNRVPRSGRIVGLRYFPGQFLDARDTECHAHNEQFWIDLAEGPPGRLVRVKQIAGAIARRIVCWLKPGEEVTAGERLGMIKFGSRTDLLVPVETIKDVCVKVGDKVRGGATILLRLNNDPV
jgi:phosphatidylserine decarboxylase